MVAETWDGHLNDINGFHVQPEHVVAALDDAAAGPVAEGNVGGGTGMICHEFKCGIGTASRVLRVEARATRVGVLVQANYGTRDALRIAGVPVASDIAGRRCAASRRAADDRLDHRRRCNRCPAAAAPVEAHRATCRLGLARMGSLFGDGSGDIFVAFSTANAAAVGSAEIVQSTSLRNDLLDGLFDATVQATEEAIVNAMVAARDMQGTEGHVATALPHAELVRLLKRYGRYSPQR